MDGINENNSKGDSIDKFEKIREYSTLLYYVFDILKLLLSNLLSSHVDNFRDNLVIEKTVSLIISLVNFLFGIYSTCNEDNTDYLNISVCECVQKLFESTLGAFREICKFNTTIKLNFKKILEHLIDNPNNKIGMMFLLNFMLNTVNSEYTIETFVEYLSKIQKKPTIDLYTDLECINKSFPIKIGHFTEGKDIIQYIISIGVSTNNDWLVNQSANVLLSIYKRYVGKNKLSIYEEITNEILNYLNNSKAKISKFNCCLLEEEKDIQLYVPDLEFLIRILKFLMIFVKSDYKFLFIFHDITLSYTKIFSNFKNYLTQNAMNTQPLSGAQQNLNDKIYDVIFLIVEGIGVICDNQRNIKNKFYYDNNIRYDLVEELPNKSQLVQVVKEFFSYITLFEKAFDLEAGLKTNSPNANKIIIITRKIIDIYTYLASSFYGQNILLSEEYTKGSMGFSSSMPVFPQSNTPLITLNGLIDKIVFVKNYGVKNENVKLLTESISKLIIILFYDLNYYENSSAKINDKNSKKTFLLTTSRIDSLMKILYGTSVKIASPVESKENMTEISNRLESIIEVLKFLGSDVMEFELTRYKKEVDCYQTSMEIITKSVTIGKLPNARKIEEKCDLLKKYFDYYQIQGYGLNFPLEICENERRGNLPLSSSLLTSNQSGFSNMGSNGTEQKTQINEFEKLLNWKKHRIFLSKANSLNIRRNNFNMDSCINCFNKNYYINEYDFYKIRKKNYYFNTDQFEQYTNYIFNSDLLFYTFSNISFSITSCIINNLYVFSKDDDYSNDIKDLFFQKLNSYKINIDDMMKIEKESLNNIMILPQGGLPLKIRKKTNSKLNQFIYKPKYDKYITNTKPIINSIQNPNKEQMRYLSKVSGRNLSTHVDNVVPGQKVVNLSYGGNTSNTNTNTNPPTTTTPNATTNATATATEEPKENHEQNPTTTVPSTQPQNNGTLPIPAQPQVLPTTTQNVQQPPNQLQPDQAQPPINLINTPGQLNTTQTQQPLNPTQGQGSQNQTPYPPGQFPGSMLKLQSSFPFPAIPPFPGQFLPGQNPQMLMNPILQGQFAQIRPQNSMYPQYPINPMNPMMPIPIMNPPQGVPQPQQAGIQPPSQPQHHPHQPIQHQQPQRQPEQNHGNSSHRDISNLANILIQMKQQEIQGNQEGSKDPRIRKKK